MTIRLFFELWAAAGLGTNAMLLSVLVEDETAGPRDMLFAILMTPFVIIMWPLILRVVAVMFRKAKEKERS